VNARLPYTAFPGSSNHIIVPISKTESQTDLRPLNIQERKKRHGTIRRGTYNSSITPVKNTTTRDPAARHALATSQTTESAKRRHTREKNQRHNPSGRRGSEKNPQVSAQNNIKAKNGRQEVSG